MKTNVGEKLDQIITMLADIVDVFGKRFDRIEATMATKDDLEKLATKGDLKAVESKVAGIDKRLDIDAIKRDHEKVPSRLAAVEDKVFGKSRAPQTPAL